MVDKWKMHREDGPAIIVQEYGRFLPVGEHWYIYGNQITNEVNEWIEENNIPPWQEWDDEIKALFVLRFL